MTGGEGERDALETLADLAFADLETVLSRPRPGLVVEDVGVLTYVGKGIAVAEGLPGVGADELLRLPGGALGTAFNLDQDEVGIILLGYGEGLKAGAQVRRTNRTLDVPVGEALLGRVIDAVGRPLDDRGPVGTVERRPIERKAPAIMDRAPVSTPLQTGLKVIDALIPIGRGQRELILGDRQTGKSAIALDTIINQRGKDVFCVYCMIGQRKTAAARLVADLRRYQAMDYTVVMVASGEDAPGLQFIAPYAATSMAEYLMDQGRDVLIVYDDLASHARAYRELSLLLRRPPGREAFPGDIFYIHSRLLERATQLRPELGGGSLTALPIVQTEAENLSAYIPTNLISITDGQIYLAPDLFQKGVLPAVDVGRSVSRVGGKAQLPAYRAITGRLRLSYSQFEELEAFSRFGTRLDPQTQRTLERGRRIREVLKQPQYEPVPPAEQVAVLLAASEGLFDRLHDEEMVRAERAVRRAVTAQLPEVMRRIEAAESPTAEERQALLAVSNDALTAEFGRDGADY